jgi:hypothetical protein
MSSNHRSTAIVLRFVSAAQALFRATPGFRILGWAEGLALYIH